MILCSPMQTYLNSWKPQGFPHKIPLWETVLFLPCEFTAAKLTSIQTAKCQQHCDSFSLWPRDAAHSPDPDYTWSKMSSSTIWFIFRAWIRSTCTLQQCSSEMTNWKEFWAFGRFNATVAISLRLTSIIGSRTTVCAAFNYLRWIWLLGNMEHIKWFPALRNIPYS